MAQINFAPSAATQDAASWLDAVPGARSAYNYLVEKLSEFSLTGLQKIPSWQTLLNSVADRIRATGDPALNAELQSAQQQVSELRATYAALESKVMQITQELSGVGLGQVPWGSVIAIGGALIAVVGGMYIFFGSAAQAEDAVRSVGEQAVARGLMTPERFAQLVRGDGATFGQGLSTLGVGLFAVAAVGAVIYFAPRGGSRRRSA